MLSSSIRTVCFVAACCLSVAGCGDPGGSTHLVAPTTETDQAQRRDIGERLFAGAVDMLNRLDEYGEGAEAGATRGPDAALEQIVRRLNESLAVLVGQAAIDDPLTLADGVVLREIVWLRDAARHAVQGETDSLRRAERLFDWVVRNIQPTPDGASVEESPPQLPWHALLLGRGTALDQAWLFQLLARQQGLDVVVLARPDTKSAEAPHWWCAALLHGGELYLFDPHVGLPIAAADGKTPATLKQAAADDKLLRAFDLPGGPAYPLRAADAAKVVALCETSSIFTTPRLERLGKLLTGRDQMVLHVDEKSLLERAGKCAHVVEARPWPMRDLRYAASRQEPAMQALKRQFRPFTVPDRSMTGGMRIVAPPLWKPRVRHVCGKYRDEASEQVTINGLYQIARPADEDLQKLPHVGTEPWEAMLRMKQHATYWLGLTAYDLQNYDAAAMYFQMLLKEQANGGWTGGARYNLGRTLEAAGKRAEAVAAYRSTALGVAPDVPCLLRAERLEGQ